MNLGLIKLNLTLLTMMGNKLGFITYSASNITFFHSLCVFIRVLNFTSVEFYSESSFRDV